MDIRDTYHHPWYHPYYTLLRDMYHPFLYHNHLYYELTDQCVIRILAERDTYVRAIECKLIAFELTPPERKWVIYLRDCCLFELHRRKYRYVLAEIIQFTHRDSTGIRHTVLATRCKVLKWLESNDQALETGDYRRDVDEYPERLQDDVERPHCSENATQFPSLAHLQYPALPESETLPVDTQDDEQQTVAVKTTMENEESQTPHSEWIMWPDYPREMLDKYPELFVPRTVRTLGRLMCDPEDIQRQYESRHELQLLAERREEVLQEFKKRDAEKKQEEEKVKKELEQKMEEEEQRRQTQYLKSEGVLSPQFVEFAIRTALNNQGNPIMQMPIAEQATTSHDDRVVVTWEEITRSVDLMNADIKTKMPHVPQVPCKPIPQFHFGYSSDSSSYSSDEVTIPQASRRPYNNSWFTRKSETSDQYIDPGTYAVPTTSSSTHVNRGTLNLIATSEDEESDGEVKQYCEAGTSTTPPSEPTFSDPCSDEATASSSTSQASMVPLRKRPASYMDYNEDSVTSGNLESDSSADNYSHPSPSDEDNASSTSPRSCEEPEELSPISESELDDTLPEIEPDFMNLSLPETPDDKEKK